jgi:hypothetical protein
VDDGKRLLLGITWFRRLFSARSIGASGARKASFYYSQYDGMPPGSMMGVFIKEVGWTGPLLSTT